MRMRAAPSSPIAGNPTLNWPEPIPVSPVDKDGGPVFDTPWQAQAFAMTLALHERGAFTWPEWTRILAREIASGIHGDDNEGYHNAWLSALEFIVHDKGLVEEREISERRAEWERAARTTPHGKPIELD